MLFKSYINQELSIFGKMSMIAKKYQAINFTQGAPDFNPPSWLLERLSYYIHHGYNQYAPISGSPALKKAIVRKVKSCYDVKINSENISITSGAIEGIFSLISSCIGQGDEVIYFDPSFDAYPAIVNFNQGVSRRIPLYENKKINIDVLANTINQNTKLIILNSPHNPMGITITREQYQEVARLIHNKNILLLSDEVYEHIYSGNSYVSALQIEELKQQLVVVQSLGKTYNLTGWRLGVCVASKSIIDRINSIKQFSSFSAPYPMQLALADGINNYPEYWENLPKFYQKQHKKLLNGLKNSHFKILPWNGSPFQILDYSSISNEDDLMFCQRLIKVYGVGLVPISSLYENSHLNVNLVRLCFAKNDHILSEGTKRLCQI